MHDHNLGERAMKQQMNTKLSAHLLGILLGASIAAPLTVYAAPGTLSDQPLFLTNKAEPNIFFMTDDSGSMDWEITVDGTGTMSPYSGEWRYVFDAADNEYSNSYNAPAQENDNNANTGVWRARNYLYNKMYYNPKTNYKPWPGVDDGGTAFKEAYIHDATTPTWNTRQDPYLAAATTVDLSTNMTTTADQDDDTTITNNTFYPARYWVWDDSTAAGSNNDTVIDATDSHTLIEILPDGSGTNKTPVCTNGVDATVTEQRTEACKLRTYADEMKNFANWFTYYRRREYAAKNAMAEVIKNASSVRMGVATLNSNAAAASEERLATMNNDMTSGNKKNLADAVFSIQSDSSTPLRESLIKVGNYYAGSGTTPFGPNVLGLDTTVPSGATGSPAECSQNFAVLLTDGYYGSGSLSTIANDDADNSSWAGTYDPEHDGTFTAQTFRFDEDPYQDTYSDSLADVAMYYYERDLRASTANKVPIRCGVDENPGQHMVTYTVAFGVKGSIDPDTLPAHPNRGYATGCTATTGSAFTWSNPSTNTGKIDDMIHAAYNGRGEYLNAANPTELSTTLTDTFQSITSRLGAASAVTFNTSVLNSTSQLYQAQFNSTQWSGELEAYDLDAFANKSDTPAWQAGALLDARNFTTNDRIIITYNDDTDAAVAFDWANLSSSQKDDLRTDAAGAQEATADYPKANAVLDYIRGERDCEIGSTGTCSLTKQFRTRASRLGDVIHSQPGYVGEPTQSWPQQLPFGEDLEAYGNYKSGTTDASGAFSSTKNAKTRTPMLYVGANDGMLHAFNATNGEEVFAYIPSMLYSTAVGKGLHALSEPGYSHKYFVDLSSTISQAYIDTGAGNDNWHTVLVGGLRGGGRGIFALNVTDPDAVIEASSQTAKETAVNNMHMWEFSNADDVNLGYTYSRPVIAPVGTSSGVEWYVIFGNGYNADTTGGADGKAYLFMLKLEGPGADNVWDEGSEYYKIPTGVGDTTTLNGLSTPALVDTNRDYIADRIYAGDLLGNMWAFDISGNPTGSSGWSSDYKSGSTPIPLFYATDGDAGAGNKQPITNKPVVATHPSVDTIDSGGSVNTPNLMIYFGTGQYLSSTDPANTNKQSFYAVWDQGDAARTVHRTDITDNSNHLVKKAFTTTTITDGSTVRVGGTEAVDYSTSPSSYGWYYDLPTSGERATTTPAVRGDLVFFNTLIPSLEPCDAGGSGWELAVSRSDGSSSCGVFDTNGDGVISCPEDVASAGNLHVTSIPGETNFIAGGGGDGGGDDGDGDGDPATCEDITIGPESCSSPNVLVTKTETITTTTETSCTKTINACSCSDAPASIIPFPKACPAGYLPITKTHTTASGCEVDYTECEQVCPDEKKPLIRYTKNSDGSDSKSTVCVTNNTHVGRFSWRELSFD